MASAWPAPEIVCPDFIYRAGDVLSGLVALHTQEADVSRFQVELALVGVALTAVLPRNHDKHEYDGTARLVFAHAQLQATEDGRFPFSFVLPSKPQELPQDRIMFSNWAPQTFFKSTPVNHVLPPSLEIPREYRYQVTASIRYELVARVASPYYEMCDLRKPIRYSLGRIDPRDISRELSSTTSRDAFKSWDLVEGARRPRGLEKLKQGGAPRIHLESFMFFPINLYLGRPIEVNVRVTPSSTSDMVAHCLPEIRLERVSITLKGLTYIRSNKRFGEHRMEFCSETSLNFLLDHENRHQVDNPHFQPFTEERHNSKKILTAPLTDASAVPSFSTYNVCRKYKLRVGIVISCIGRKIPLTEEISVTVHPPIADSENSRPIVSESELEATQGLPSYAFAVSQDAPQDVQDYVGDGFNELQPVTTLPNAISTNQAPGQGGSMESFFNAVGVGSTSSGDLPDGYLNQTTRNPPIKIPGGVDGRGTLRSSSLAEASSNSAQVSARRGTFPSIESPIPPQEPPSYEPRDSHAQGSNGLSNGSGRGEKEDS